MPPPLAVQLTPLRAEMAQDLGGVLERLAQIGYLGVEAASPAVVSVADLRDQLKEHGLALVGTFGPGGDWDQFLDQQEILGSGHVVSSLLPESFATPDAVAAAAERFDAIGERVRARGMTLYYHNHSWEFDAWEDGTVPIYPFLERLDSAIALEPDIYWVKAAGYDPAATLERFGPRVRRLHVKDGPGTAPNFEGGLDALDPQTAVGTGTVDIPAALAAAPQADWHVVEFDKCAGDIFEALEASYRYLTEHGLSQGRTP